MLSREVDECKPLGPTRLTASSTAERGGSDTLAAARPAAAAECSAANVSARSLSSTSEG